MEKFKKWERFTDLVRTLYAYTSFVWLCGIIAVWALFMVYCINWGSPSISPSKINYRAEYIKKYTKAANHPKSDKLVVECMIKNLKAIDQKHWDELDSPLQYIKGKCKHLFHD